jgi:WD40 repeat protein
MDLKRGSVHQLAFTSDSKQLLVLNSNPGHKVRREPTSSRLRLFSTADWKAIADTEEKDDVTGPFIALSRGNTCVFICGEYFPRAFGTGYGNHLYHSVDLQTLKLKKFEPTGMATLYPGGPYLLGCTDNKLLFAPLLLDSAAPFVFDLKTGKKTIELQDFPKKISKRMFGEFSSDGKHVLTYLDGNLRLHVADTGKLLKTTPVDSQVYAMAISQDGKQLAAYCASGEILLVKSDLSKKTIPLKVKANKKINDAVVYLQSLAFAGNGYLALFAARGFNIDGKMEGGEIKLYDTKEWKLRHTFEKKGTNTQCIAGSPDGKWLAAGFGINGSVPGSVCIWEAKSGKLVKEFE